MKRFKTLVWTGLCGVLLSGCAAIGSAHSALRKPSTLFCPDADTALAGISGPRATFNSNKAVCAGDRLRLAAQLMEGSASGADLNRARSLVDSVQAGVEVEHSPSLAGLAQLLDHALVDRRHADERIDKLTAQTHDQQLHIDDLSAKLAALTEVERTMALKARKKRGAP